MFTGIVERTARVRGLLDKEGGRRLTLGIDAPGVIGPGCPEPNAETPVAGGDSLPAWRPAVLGESISVNGVCLTVVESSRTPEGLRELVAFDVVPETLGLTTLGQLREGDPVNVERSLRVGDSFGGHYVTGHVDGVGTVSRRTQEGDQVTFEIRLPEHLVVQILRKGSIAVDGVSLTVVDVERKRTAFTFAAIPHTLERTTLRDRGVGSQVNIETDAFGKWVIHSLTGVVGTATEPGGLIDWLRDRELAQKTRGPNQ